MPGDLLFKVRLTYEDLVETQTQFLKSLSELEVEKREITRLEEAVQSGAVPGKSLIERRYAKEKLDAYLTSLRESLKLHGLSTEQILAIESDRKLLRDLTIVAPEIDTHDREENLRLSRLPIRPASFSLPQPPHQHVARPLCWKTLKLKRGKASCRANCSAPCRTIPSCTLKAEHSSKMLRRWPPQRRKVGRSMPWYQLPTAS